MSKRLASDGFAVVVNYPADTAAAEAVVDEIQTAGGVARAVRADVGDPASSIAMLDAAEQRGMLAALVNNAGIMKLATAAESSDDLFDRHVATNFKGVFGGIREAARRLRPGGRIVSFSSRVVGVYLPTYAVYAATKAGVEAMTHVAAKDL